MFDHSPSGRSRRDLGRSRLQFRAKSSKIALGRIAARATATGQRTVAKLAGM
jgi:hypothetical protein